jgi:hypothetical protein
MDKMPEGKNLRNGQERWAPRNVQERSGAVNGQGHWTV